MMPGLELRNAIKTLLAVVEGGIYPSEMREEELTALATLKRFTSGTVPGDKQSDGEGGGTGRPASP